MIPVKRDLDAEPPLEHCCFCDTPTAYWTALRGRPDGEQVACCKACAKKHEPVDGEPITREVSWEQVRAYLRAKGWAVRRSEANGDELWHCEGFAEMWIGSRYNIAIVVGWIARSLRRHPSAVLLDIARGTEPAGVEPLSEEELQALAATAGDMPVVDRLLATVRAREAANREGVLAEREACALIADEYTPGGNHLRRRREDADRIAERS